MVALGVPLAMMLLAAPADAASAPAPGAPSGAARTSADPAPLYGPKYDPPKPKPAAAPAPDPLCENRQNQREIVICAQRPHGYRLNPDVIQAKREKRSGGRPTRPGPIAMKDNSRCVVGPQGCPSAGINLIAAALTAATMASRIAKGEEIGSMFKTTPEPTEYDLYVAAKHRREAEAKEAAEAAKAKAAAGEPAKAQPEGK